jgi:D-3-phosphoglycerate dehydrogenase
MLRALCPEPENYSHKGLAFAASFVDLTVESLSQKAFAARSIGYDILIVRVLRRVTRDMIANAPQLKAIVTPTTGHDHIDLEAASSRNIPVFSLFGQAEFLKQVHSSAEHSFALLLSLIRRIPAASNSVKQGRWEQQAFRGHELYGKTIGIVGFGRIGSKMAAYANGFSMNILAYDPYVDTYPLFVHRLKSLDELMTTCDIVSIHVPLNRETQGMIGARELTLLPQRAIVINTARGAVIDETALLSHLQSGHLQGAGLDVLTNEHLILQQSHALIEYARSHDNLLITPHIGGTAEEAIEKTDIFVLNQLNDWLHSRNTYE